MSPEHPSVWITYAWSDNVHGDFTYLVQELASVGVYARYDRIALVPGQRLWDQIAARIGDLTIAGWAYLITQDSLASEPCREEMAYALDRALRTRGKSFPLIGLLHDVPIANVPLALRVRLCVSLASPNWKEEVRAGLEGRPAASSLPASTRYVWKVHQGFAGIPGSVAIEVRPRFDEIMYWRFIVSSGASVTHWGHGPSDGGPLSFVRSMSVEGGSGTFNGTPVTWFGSGNKLSPGTRHTSSSRVRSPKW